MANNEHKLKRIVIKEELVELTGDWMASIVLSQFLYWGERVKDFDAFIEEENNRNAETNIQPTHGWIYKSAKELTEELMLSPGSDGKVTRAISKLVDSNWLERRNNPSYAWDRTYQYRPNIAAIQKALQKLGYALDGYPLLESEESIPYGEESIPYGEEWKTHSAEALPETTQRLHTEINSPALSGRDFSSAMGSESHSKRAVYADDEIEYVEVGHENDDPWDDQAPQNPLEHLIASLSNGYKFSKTSRRKLTDPVSVVCNGKPTLEPSPVKEMQTYPEEFSQWVKKQAVFLRNNGGCTVPKLCNMVKKYETPTYGWLAVRPKPDYDAHDPDAPWNR